MSKPWFKHAYACPIPLNVPLCTSSAVTGAKSQISQALPINSQLHPSRHLHCTQALVELQTRLVPLQTAPLQSPTIDLEHLLRQRAYQQLPVSSLSVLRSHEQVLQIYARLTSPGAIVIEVHRHAGHGTRGESGMLVSFRQGGRKSEDESFGVAWVRVLS